MLALGKLHRHDILHLDIKSDNILMMNKYTPVLADFGFSFIKSLQSRNYTCGTPCYQAPETIQ